MGKAYRFVVNDFDGKELVEGYVIGDNFKDAMNKMAFINFGPTKESERLIQWAPKVIYKDSLKYPYIDHFKSFKETASPSKDV